MIIFGLWYWLLTVTSHLRQASHSGCYPVPIPGTADLTMEHFRTGQQLITDFWQTRTASREGEGYHGPTAVVGADSWIQEYCHDSANSGQQPPMSYCSNIPTRPYTQVHKRSYKRACRRALLHGRAQYHGCPVTPRDFPPALVQKLQQQLPPQGHQPQKRPIPLKAVDRLTCLHWNPGGLSQSMLLEIKHWLRYNRADVVVISETKWSFSSTWTDREWLYVHSATSDYKSGGILTMISRRIAEPEQLGYASIIDGRLLHIRVHYATRALDIIATYQYVAANNQTSIHQQNIFWTAINELLCTLPQRNNLLCAGDFNCGLVAQPPWVGTSTFKWEGKQHSGPRCADQDHFQTLLKTHGLTALNTWGASGPTYIHGSHASRIDHFLIRLLACDGVAKQVQFLPSAAFVPHNHTHHIPMLCTIRQKHMAYQKHDGVTSCTFAQRNQCRIAGLQDTSTWHQLRQQVIHSLHDDLQALTPDEVITTVHQRVSTAFHTFFPGKHPTACRIDHSQVHRHIEDKWFHKRQLRQHEASNTKGLQILFRAWYHRSRYQTLQREQQRAARQAKKHQFHQLCHEVAEAARHHDTHSMFLIINKYSPKKPLARTRLRGPDGSIADQFMAHSMTVSFVKQMWQGPHRLPVYSEAAPGVPFALDELVAAVGKLHPNKSVAQPFLPGVVWKSAPMDVALFLFQLLNHWWSHSPPTIPQNWKDSWLFFLPKPGKPNTHPDQLRPISLMEPLGKLVMGLLATKIRDHVFPVVCSTPQFGFLPHRAATDAILRVATHSRCIRALVRSHRRTVPNQICRPIGSTICGGLSLFQTDRPFLITSKR